MYMLPNPFETTVIRTGTAAQIYNNTLKDDMVEPAAFAYTFRDVVGRKLTMKVPRAQVNLKRDISTSMMDAGLRAIVHNTETTPSGRYLLLSSVMTHFEAMDHVCKEPPPNDGRCLSILPLCPGRAWSLLLVENREDGPDL